QRSSTAQTLPGIQIMLSFFAHSVAGLLARWCPAQRASGPRPSATPIDQPVCRRAAWPIPQPGTAGQTWKLPTAGVPNSRASLVSCSHPKEAHTMTDRSRAADWRSTCDARTVQAVQELARSWLLAVAGASFVPGGRVRARLTLEDLLY